MYGTRVRVTHNSYTQQEKDGRGELPTSSSGRLVRAL
jgi:hypothetical protein